jgi:hypothetical protein
MSKIVDRPVSRTPHPVAESLLCNRLFGLHTSWATAVALDFTLYNSSMFETAGDEQDYAVSTIDVEPQFQL